MTSPPTGLRWGAGTNNQAQPRLAVGGWGTVGASTPSLKGQPLGAGTPGGSPTRLPAARQHPLRRENDQALPDAGLSGS